MKLSEKKMLKKKEEIILSAIKIVNRKGYQSATMEEIAAELLMTKGSLYYYFKNKEDLIFQCHERVLSNAMDELKVHLEEQVFYEERLRRMIVTHIDYAIEEKETFNMIIKLDEMLLTDKLNPLLEKRNAYESYFDQVIQGGIEANEFTIAEPKIVRMILLGAMNWIQQWYRPAGEMTKEKIQEIYSDYLLKLLK
ncbi:TetR/AcrR family transcriptional regulator [Peribacillus asahii]|uniref:TetR/AcrR family transcriptional regulator n=1 Tax=Peribacillus asahii TaxID=228899 RepID=UPI00207AC94B|nr:TetR/AcrR family transcriptional regulator [Peribacillus asahii]USK68691.1 TetR/AcrR family transcriptional regulator [Peribacillus asahii]